MLYLVLMKSSIVNALISILALFLIALGFYCLSNVWTVANGNGTLYLISGFIAGGTGVGLFIYLITTAKD
jgi:hypothetical protein